MHHGAVVEFDPVRGIGILKYYPDGRKSQIFVDRSSLSDGNDNGEIPRLYKGQQVSFQVSTTAFGRPIACEVRPSRFDWRTFRPEKNERQSLSHTHFQPLCDGDAIAVDGGVWAIQEEHRLSPWALKSSEIADLTLVAETFSDVLGHAKLFSKQLRRGRRGVAIFLRPDQPQSSRLFAWGRHFRGDDAVSLWVSRWFGWRDGRCSDLWPIREKSRCFLDISVSPFSA